MTLVTFGAFAQAQGSASLEAGYIPESATAIREPVASYTDMSHVLYITLQMQIPVFTYGFIGGSVTTTMGLAENGGFLPIYGSPIGATYVFNTGLVIGDVIAGVRHSCAHPVTPNGIALVVGDADYTQIYINYTVKF
jgi:hypothetical protein